MSSYCITCGSMIPSGLVCPSCGNQNPAPSTPPTLGGFASSSTGAFVPPPPGRKMLGASITLLVFSALGLISPFLAYITDDYDSISGWDSRQYFSDYGEFSAGPILVLIGSVVSLIVAIAVIVGQSNGKPANRVVAGIASIVAGVLTAGSVGLSYQAWDNILIYEGFYANEGAGLWTGIVSGIGSVVLGIILLAVTSATRGKA